MISLRLLCARTPVLNRLVKGPINVAPTIWNQPSITNYTKSKKYFGSVESDVRILKDKYGYFIECPERIARAQFHDIFDFNGYGKPGDIVYVPKKHYWYS